jgi:hypothetical protein
MFTKFLASGVALLALSAGVAYAATQLASSDGTEVCVNEVNGLMRVASTCRESEYPLTIGGGGNVEAHSGTFADVAWGATSTGVTLPLTGVTLAGKCEAQGPVPPYLPYEVGLARLLITRDGGMAAFMDSSFAGGTIGGTSVLTDPATTAHDAGVANHLGTGVLVRANGATATIAFGAQVNAPARTCTYFWHAIESPD